MTFSFVLPAYKSRYLSESINSILLQDYDNFELIVVDDCSTDPIRQIVSEFNDERITYYRNEQNIGGKDLVAQWNHCLEYAHGDYVILATDDDLYEPNFLSSFVPLIDKYPEVNLFRARILQVNSKNAILRIDSTYKEYLSELEFRYYMMHGIRGGIPQYIFKRSVLVSNGGFVNFPFAWGADDATAMMMASYGIVNSQEHLVRFRYSDINISSDQKHTGTAKLEARLMLASWLKNHPVIITDDGEWGRFFHKEISDYCNVYIKQLLIIRVSALSLKMWITAYNMIKASHLLVFRDICSVFYHALRKKLT